MTLPAASDVTIGVEKIKHELQRLIKGHMRWHEMSYWYLQDLLDIGGMSSADAAQMRGTFTFEWGMNGKTKWLLIHESTYGTTVTMVWENEE